MPLRHFAGASALVLSLLMAGCSKKEAAAGGRGGGGPAPVLVAKAQTKVVPLTLEAIGAVEPSRTATIRSQVTGVLMKIHFQEGQDVQQGDLLFQIDPRPFQNAVKSAEADLEKSRLQLDTARTQVARYRTLKEGSMVSQEQFQTIQDTERVLATDLLASESALATAKLQLDYCSIRAPLPGRTGAVGAHEGDLVRASDTSTPLVIVHQLSPISVTFGVPQQYVAPITRYRATGPIAVHATPPGNEETPETGELSFVDNAVDSSSGTIKLKATFPNQAHRLWPGQFANISILLAAPEAIIVPASAVENDQEGQHVFIVKPDNTAEFRKVVVERTANDVSVIASGVAAGETVVIDGQLRVVPGRPVQIKQPRAAAEQASPVKPAPASGEKKKGKST
ncbi:MAG TPA: efflux RND transporter periplasmic adaptor subunit [Opitutaceae bacterium]|nr:efflux RND transporter periplasmic adaptor subunit [Opitutaceae bacterium]